MKAQFKKWACSALALLVAAGMMAVPLAPRAMATETNPPQEPPASESSNNDLYIANYAAVDVNGNELASISPGQTFILAITVVDERVDTNKDGHATVGNARVRLNPGAFTIPSLSNIEYKERTNVGGKLSYTITFRNITYVGGAPNLSFDITYVDGANNPMGLPMVTQTQSVGQCSDTSTKPEVVLRSSSYGGSSVTAGQNFTLSTSAYNTSANLKLDGVIATIKLPDNMGLASGASSVVVGDVAPNGTINANFNLSVKGTAETGSASVTVEYTYYALVQGQSTQCTSTQVISIPVVQPDRFEINQIQAPTNAYVGEEVAISLSFANKGKGIVYNLSGEVSGNMTNPGQKQFLGNIAAGAENSIDFYVTPGEAGTMNGEIALTYEDANGKATTVKTPFSLTVEEMPDFSGGDLPTDIMPVEQPKSKLPLIIGGVVVAAAAVGGFLFYKKKVKAKKEAEAEDEDF